MFAVCLLFAFAPPASEYLVSTLCSWFVQFLYKWLWGNGLEKILYEQHSVVTEESQALHLLKGYT